MIIIKKIISIIKKKISIIKKIYYFINPQASQQVYIKRISRKAPWIYISYISEVYYLQNNLSYIYSHQNKQEALLLAPFFNSIGYNVYIQSLYSNRKLPNINPLIVFGIEPNFEKACHKWPKAIKIYYATGAYYEHQNKQIINGTDSFNSKYHCNIGYNRLVTPHDSCLLSDYILQIGSGYTKKTYPEHLQSKITLIHQSSIPISFFNTKYSYDNEFFYMASGGNILKGLHLLIDFFSKHTSLILNIVGPIEEDIHKALKNTITPNIHMHGYLEINSSTMREIVSKCNFLLYASGSEGGMPGAVIHSMKMGLIPIVSQWSATEEINNCGFIMDEWNESAIDNGIRWSKMLLPQEIEKLKEKCHCFASNSYTLENYSAEIKKFFYQFLQ